MKHEVSTDLLQRAVRIHVVGCGGTGSQFVPGLIALHKTLRALGHPDGIEATVWDSDQVQEHNCLRQNFFEVDVGRNKAEIMVNRLNIAHGANGVNWTAEPRCFSEGALGYGEADFLIGCVDSKTARAGIREAIKTQHHCYWLDCGNDAESGQVIIGEWGRRLDGHANRLPLVTELFPEIADGADEDKTPSCSAIQSIQRQGVVTNRMAATWALAWLDEALRYGKVGWCGVFFNLKTGRVTSIPVDPATWEGLGYKIAAPERQHGEAITAQ